MIAVLALLVAACRIGEAPPTTGEAPPTTGEATSGSITTEGGTTPTEVGGIDALIEAARAEGTLNTIGLPHDYCNYDGVIEGFKSKYGIEVNEIAPDAGPADGLEAIRLSQGSIDAQSPDVVDIGMMLAPEAQAEGLLQRYQVESWDSIPDHAKDAGCLLVRRLLRRVGFRRQRGLCPDGAGRLVRPARSAIPGTWWRWPATPGFPIRRFSRCSPRLWPTAGPSTTPSPASSTLPN